MSGSFLRGRFDALLERLSGRERRRRLEEAERIKDFVTSVTHELRSPLTSVVVSLDLIRRDAAAGSLSSGQRRLLQVIENNVDGLQRFITDLLDLEKIERGKMELRKERTCLGAVVRESVLTLSGVAEQKGIELLPPPLCREFPILADPGRVRQVLTNLLSNSLKFTPIQGRVEVRLEESAEGYLTSVIDNGKGIPPEELDRIFDKYVQVRYFHRDAAELKGTGLGLAVARHLVEAHDGRLWAESEPGRGAAFHFTLPKAPPN